MMVQFLGVYNMAEIRLVSASLQEYSEPWILLRLYSELVLSHKFKKLLSPLTIHRLFFPSKGRRVRWCCISFGSLLPRRQCELRVAIFWVLKSLYVTSSREKFRLLFLTSVYELELTQLLVICSREWAPDQRERTPNSCIFPFRETDLLLCRGRKTTAVIKRRETPERERLKTAHWAA